MPESKCNSRRIRQIKRQFNWIIFFGSVAIVIMLSVLFYEHFLKPRAVNHHESRIERILKHKELKTELKNIQKGGHYAEIKEKIDIL